MSTPSDPLYHEGVIASVLQAALGDQAGAVLEKIRESRAPRPTAGAVLAIPAGSALDALVARHVMGICPHEHLSQPNEDARPDSFGNHEVLCLDCGSMVFWHEGPDVTGYSSRIHRTWEMEERLAEQEDRILVGYASWLYAILGVPFNKILGSAAALQLVHASAEVRCKAAVLAMLGEYPPEAEANAGA